MSVATSDRLQAALVRMAAPLVTERARAGLLAFSRVVCPVVDTIGIEYRVSSDQADQVDVSVSAATFAARAALAREVAALAESDPSTWAAASRCLVNWCVRGTDEARSLGAAYLEYDLEPGCVRSVVPSVFVSVAGLSLSWDRDRTRRGLGQAVRWVAGDRAVELTGPLDALLAALPENFHLAHLGFMFSRRDEGLRLNLTVPSHGLDEVLGRLGWSGSLAGAREFLPVADNGGWVTLAFGFGPSGMTERLGIEAAPSRKLGGDGLLAALTRGGWCTAAKGQALSALLDVRDAGERYELSHVKLVTSRSGATDAKVYLMLALGGPRLGRLAAAMQIQGRARPARREARALPAASE